MLNEVGDQGFKRYFFIYYDQSSFFKSDSIAWLFAKDAISAMDKFKGSPKWRRPNYEYRLFAKEEFEGLKKYKIFWQSPQDETIWCNIYALTKEAAEEEYFKRQGCLSGITIVETAVAPQGDDASKITKIEEVIALAG